jgi:hypothetical protein
MAHIVKCKCGEEIELLTPVEAAALTGFAECTWRAWAPTLPGAFKMGKQWIIPRSVVEAVMASYAEE